MKDKKNTKTKSVELNQQLLSIVGSVIIGLGIIVAIFVLGWHYGAANQTSKDKKALAAATSTIRSRNPLGASIVAERHVFVGDVTAVNATSMTVKTTSGQTQTAQLNSKTIVSSTKSPTSSTSAIKVGSHVFVTCTQNSNKSLTAQRVLIIR